MARPHKNVSKDVSKQIPEYDCTLKALFGKDAAEILPILLPGTKLLYDHNIEIDRSQLRADLVYNVLYRGIPHILNMELQTDEDKKMHLRLLQYHVHLHEKYDKPVLSVVLYPFERHIPIPPYIERSGDEALLIYKYQTIALYTMEAEKFRREKNYCMYSLLPAMGGANPKMLIQTLHDMKQCYPREKLRHHLDRFWKMLQKSITVQPEGKRQVEKELKMQFDWFIDTIPEVIERVEQAGLHGKLETLRWTIMQSVRLRFPTLIDFAQVQVDKLTTKAQLESLVLDLLQFSDKVDALHVLSKKRG
jgi:hypothetical protein